MSSFLQVLSATSLLFPHSCAPIRCFLPSVTRNPTLLFFCLCDPICPFFLTLSPDVTSLQAQEHNRVHSSLASWSFLLLSSSIPIPLTYFSQNPPSAQLSLAADPCYSENSCYIPVYSLLKPANIEEGSCVFPFLRPPRFSLRRATHNLSFNPTRPASSLCNDST